MSRSKWKGPFISETKILNDPSTNKKNLIITRNSEIVPKFIGLTFYVHNGKNFSEISVTENMVGHKFGEFSFTRAKFIFKKKLKK